MKLIYASAFYLCCAVLCSLPFWSFAQATNGYCYNKGTRGNIWLQKVSIGNWSFNSGGNSGYLYQADSKLSLNADTSYTIQLELGGYPRIQDSAYWRIWVDFNQDLDFEDAGEQVFQSKTVHKGAAKGTLKLPRLFEAKKYMMRIVVSKTRFSPACGESSVIEMEDYFGEINPVFRCNTPLANNILIGKIGDNKATLSVKDLPALRYRWHVESIDGKFSKDTVQVESSPLVLEGLSETTKYKVRLKIECAGGESHWSEDVFFNTLPKNLCPAMDKDKILVVQRAWNFAELKYPEVNNSALEWQYRIKGTEPWIKHIRTSLQVPEGVIFEVQVRAYCIAQGIWTDWSESALVELNPCFFPEVKNVVVNTSFFFHPTLQSSIHFNNGTYDPFLFKWYYREKDAQEWIDTVKETSNSIDIHNLIPGKTYELRIDIHCGQDSLSIYRTVQVTPLCQSIQASQLKVIEIYDTSAWIRADLLEVRTLEFRYRERGAAQFAIAQLKKGILTGLKPNVTYEISVRVVCEDSIPDWSASVFFTTTNCRLPPKGDLEVIQSYLPDSIRFEAQFLNFSGAENFNFHWRYRIADTSEWQNLELQEKKREMLLKNLTRGTKYELQMSVNCPGNPLDSFALTTSFTAVADDCAPKPDTGLISLKYQDKTLDLLITFKVPKGYDYQIRTKPENSGPYTNYFTPFSDRYITLISLYPGINDFQFRLICPNGNVSPWSDVIKVRNLKGFAEPEIPQLALSEAYQTLLNQVKSPLRIAPNPSSGQFSILFPAAMEPQPEAHLEVLNTAGQRIWGLKTSIDPAQTLPLDLSKQTPGLYILRIHAGQKVFTERIIIGSNR